MISVPIYGTETTYQISDAEMDEIIEKANRLRALFEKQEEENERQG